MGRIFQELFGHWLQHMLGCEGLAAMVLLMGWLWFGHYAMPGTGAHRWHRMILAPISIACLIAAAIVCSVTTFLVLASLASLSYFVYVSVSRGKPND